jgi:hypothetical protein|tara:strand:+ start:411 stop:1052 length:642 start_codon:yes stop_codon:yes gene_type:complete
MIDGTKGSHKPEWLFEEFCDVDVERLQKDLGEMDKHLPWFDFQDADDSDSEVALAWKESSDTRVDERYKGATRGKRARLRDTPYHLRADTYYQEIKEQYKLIGGTYARMEARSSYQWHTDKAIGFQIPVISNEHCSFIFKLDDNKSYAFTPKLGKAYLVNNLIEHTFINGGDIPRYYLLQIVNPPALLSPMYKKYARTSGFPYRDYILSKDFK